MKRKESFHKYAIDVHPICKKNIERLGFDVPLIQPVISMNTAFSLSRIASNKLSHISNLSLFQVRFCFESRINTSQNKVFCSFHIFSSFLPILK